MPSDVRTVSAADIFGAAFDIDPHPAFARLRESGAVHRVEFNNGRSAWLVVGYDAARQAFLDPRLSSSTRVADSAFQAMQQSQGLLNIDDRLPILLYSDPPHHTRLRRIITREFTTKRAEALRPRVQSIADGLIDALPVSGSVDLMEAYAYPLPSAVICELLGVPHEDWKVFSNWFNVLISPSVEANYGEMSHTLRETWAYFTELIGRHRQNPGTDLLSALVSARADDRLNDSELVAMALLLVVGGFETTATLIGNGVLALLRHPEQLAKLRADPALVPGAVEEMLRFGGPAKVFPPRYAREETVIAGQPIVRGDQVFVLMASANRDAGKYPDPDAFDVTRDASGHMAFGHGIHRCVGAPLARIEAQIAIAALLDRLGHARLDVPVEDLVWREGLTVHGTVALPIRFDAAPPA
ncbi:cytochrome P450 [Actinoplanes sp. NPDC049265]|uniref:cytochrome P450 family protein n=1 Tax=Actinoplanes sp. NPDC049265 TaxID=3363902 RepID=UPI003718640E